MLTQLLSNDVLKEGLFQVVTNLGPPSGDSSEQGEICFQYTRDIPPRNVIAWKIIDEVYQDVECKNLTVDVVQLQLENIGKSLASKEGRKSDGGGRSWKSFMRSFRF